MAKHLSYTITDNDLGKILIAYSDLGLCALLLGDSVPELVQEAQQRFSAATLTHTHPQPIVEQVLAFLAAPDNTAALPLDVRGTDFQRRVWQTLQTVPRGTTISYSALAANVGQPTAARAVASACAANPIAIVIPCHRVLRSDGSLGGYRWGIERKRQLLAMECA